MNPSTDYYSSSESAVVGKGNLEEANVYNNNGNGTVKCFLHLDMDCFYAQVEMLRLQASPEVPLAVQQWSMLIAVNYPARARGVTRFLSAKEAKEKCPELVLVHVPTFAEGDVEPQYRTTHHSDRHKVSLDPYRRESNKIFAVIEKFCPLYERASVDEAFIDVTDKVDELMKANPQPTQNLDITLSWEGLGVTVGNESNDDHNDDNSDNRKSYTIDDLRIWYAAKLAQSLRKMVYDELRYKCSTGVAQNKMLSKLCSGMNKPNQQTVMPPSQVLEFMKTLPLQKIRNLGGKLGKSVLDQLSVKTAGDLWLIPQAALQRKYGESTGLWLWQICRGIDVSPVVQRKYKKSMAAVKNIPRGGTVQDIQKWTRMLAAELAIRLGEELEQNFRWPKTFSLHMDGRSRGTSMFPSPINFDAEIMVEQLYQLTLRLLSNFPIATVSHTVGIAVSNFDTDAIATGAQPITKFFGKSESAEPNDEILSDDNDDNDSAYSNSLRPSSPASASSASAVAKKFIFKNPTKATTTTTPPSAEKKNSFFKNFSLKENSGMPMALSSPRPPMDSSSSSSEGINNNYTPSKKRLSESKSDKDAYFPTEKDFTEYDPRLPLIISHGIPPEKRNKTIHRFFTSEKEREYAAKQGKYLCPKCGKMMPLVDQQEHEDYHYAKNLSSMND